MTRTEAFVYLSRQLATMLTEVGVDLDDLGSLDPVIDQALLWQGVAWSDLGAADVDDADVGAYLALLRYAGIQYVYDAALSRVDIQVSDPNVSKSRSQFVRQLENSLKTAREAAEPYIVGGGAFQTGSIVFGDRTVPVGYEELSWLY